MYINETLAPLFANAKIPTLPLLRRVNGAGMRFYYETLPDGSILDYPNETGVIDTLWQSPFLQKWKTANGEEAETYTQERAVYGTIEHSLFAQMAQEWKLDPAAIPYKMSEILLREGMVLPAAKMTQWQEDLEQDLLALGAWLQEREVEPLLIECPVRSTTLKVASVIDLVCWLTFNKKRVLAIVDLKSSRKGIFGFEKTLQLMFYEYLLRENLTAYTDWQDVALFNLSPKDWQSKPSYHFKNHTDDVKAVTEQFQSEAHILELPQFRYDFLQFCMLQYRIFTNKKNPLSTTIRRTGLIDLAAPIMDAYRMVTVADAITEEIRAQIPQELRA